jgi:hypothetical protein
VREYSTRRAALSEQQNEWMFDGPEESLSINSVSDKLYYSDVKDWLMNPESYLSPEQPLDGFCIEEIYAILDDAHKESSIVRGRGVASVILWSMIHEKHLIKDPTLPIQAAIRLVINYPGDSPLYELQASLQSNEIVMDKNLATNIIESVIYDGIYGSWPDGEFYNYFSEGKVFYPTPQTLGSAIISLAEPNWLDTLQDSELFSKCLNQYFSYFETIHTSAVMNKYKLGSRANISQQSLDKIQLYLTGNR